MILTNSNIIDIKTYLISNIGEKFIGYKRLDKTCNISENIMIFEIILCGSYLHRKYMSSVLLTKFSFL